MVSVELVVDGIRVVVALGVEVVGVVGTKVVVVSRVVGAAGPLQPTATSNKSIEHIGTFDRIQDGTIGLSSTMIRRRTAVR